MDLLLGVRRNRSSPMKHVTWYILGVFILVISPLTVGSRSSITLEGSKLDSSPEGTVLVSYNGQVGTICSSGFTDKDSLVLCNQYGYAMGDVTTSASSGGYNMTLQTPSCEGHEEDILNCSGSTWGYYQCNNQLVASVKCSLPYSNASDTQRIRLVSGTSPGQGRVELANSAAEWGTICDDSWFDDEAKVVCRELTYSKGTAVSRASFGEGTGRIWTRSVSCMGTEFKLTSCFGFSYGDVRTSCDHSEDAGVICTERLPEHSIRVESESSGVVYMAVDSAWHGICMDHMSTSEVTKAGQTACKQLGYSDLDRASKTSYSSSSYTSVRLVNCSGSESGFNKCRNLLTAPAGKVFSCSKFLKVYCENKKKEGGGSMMYLISIPVVVVICTGSVCRKKHAKQNRPAPCQPPPPPPPPPPQNHPPATNTSSSEAPVPEAASTQATSDSSTSSSRSHTPEQSYPQPRSSTMPSSIPAAALSASVLEPSAPSGMTPPPSYQEAMALDPTYPPPVPIYINPPSYGEVKDQV